MRVLTHDQETDSNCLRDPDELLLVGLCSESLARYIWYSNAESRTGAAVHEQSALLEELSGHTVRMLAVAPPYFVDTGAYSANSLTFSMATDVRLCDVERVVGVLVEMREQLTLVGVSKEVARARNVQEAPGFGEQSGLAEKADQG